jgi:hypothetical protein
LARARASISSVIVEADRAAGRADARGADEDVGAGARTEVQDRLALVEIGDGGRDAAAERGLHGCGRRAGRLVAVEGGAEDLDAVGVGAAQVRVGAARERAVGWSAATPAGPLGDAIGGSGVALADELADVGVLAQLSHAVSSSRASGRT